MSTISGEPQWNTLPSIPQLLQDSTYAYLYDGGSSPFAQANLSTGAITYFLHDQLGSVRGVVNSSGSVVVTTSYDAWGKPINPIDSNSSFGFSGGYSDPTGLSYFISRYYEPGSGQFVNVDPAVSATGQAYAYSLDDPVNFVDLFGNLPAPAPGSGVTPSEIAAAYRLAQQHSRQIQSATQKALWQLIIRALNNKGVGMTGDAATGFHKLVEDTSVPFEAINPPQLTGLFRALGVPAGEYGLAISAVGLRGSP